MFWRGGGGKESDGFAGEVERGEEIAVVRKRRSGAKSCRGTEKNLPHGDRMDTETMHISKASIETGELEPFKRAYLNTIKRTVKYLCPADIVPPYIDVDLSELDVGQKILVKDLRVHPALKLLHPQDQPVCNLRGARAPDQKKSK
ncbi:hypothetical protein KSP40_PGU009499 [Platanthera guangdongensis]|uniref:Large ribosomal subunit protein bL25 beta domain-containing protein n=1 Tax=Platanthera guangdongensis TaxID=2320717 RepID=A0ABR2LTX2_9ASPA